MRKKLSFDENKLANIIYFLTLASFTLPIIYTAVSLISSLMGNEPNLSEAFHNDLLAILQCLLGAAAIHLPRILKKLMRLEIPPLMYILYLIFLFCSIYLGEFRNFYELVPYWDDILHALSGIITGFFAFMLTSVFMRKKSNPNTVSPLFIALFALTFSVTIGVLWEIYEFTLDSCFGLNMQKYKTADGVLLTGTQALTDTMKDLIIDTLSAVLTSTVGYFSIKNKRGKINEYFEINSENRSQK